MDGWTFGTGVEFRDWWLDGVYTRLEYRYTDLGNKAVSGYDLGGDFYKVSTNQNVQGIYHDLRLSVRRLLISALEWDIENAGRKPRVFVCGTPQPMSHRIDKPPRL